MNLIIDASQLKINCIDGFMNISIPSHCLSKKKDDIKHILYFLNEVVPYPTLKKCIEEALDCTLTLNPETQDLDEVPPLPPSNVSFVPYVSIPNILTSPSHIIEKPILTQVQIDKAIDKLQEDLEEKRRSTLENREINEKDGDLML